MKYQKITKAAKRAMEGGEIPPIRGRVKHYTPRPRPSVDKKRRHDGREVSARRTPYLAPVERNAPDGGDALREHGKSFKKGLQSSEI